jgi:murein DD-endopeptidase MepM/ murein hydrolase activator NlpD
MNTASRIAWFTIALASGLILQPSARGESSALRGIAADVAAGRLLDDANTQDTRDDEADAELATLSTQEQQASQTLKTRVRALYRITRAGMAPVAGGFDAVRLHVARVRRMTLLVRSDLHTLRTLESRELSIKTRKHQQADARAKSAAELIAPHPLSLAGRRSPLMAANSARPDGTEAMPSPSGGFYGLRLSDSNDSTGFASKQGRLATPVAGEFRVVDARRSESDGSGIEFQAPAGTSVRAVASGRVAFSDRYGSYGRLVILDHGDGFYTAYGGLGSVEVRVGDELSAFARLGSIAASNGSMSALYFEVRKATKTLPPRQWLGL